MKRKFAVCFDIDGTICSITDGEYEKAKPYTEMIDLINKLYDDGVIIIFNTARGMGTCRGIVQKAKQKWYKFTENQLKEWGVKYHELYIGKPQADVYIDDRAIWVNNNGSSAGELKKILARIKKKND